MNKVDTRQAHSKSKLTREQIEALEEAGFTPKQIAALPDKVDQLSSTQIDLAVEIGAIPDYEEIPLNQMVQPSDVEIDFSDIPRRRDRGWQKAVVIPAKKTKRLMSIRLDPDIADYFQMQGKGYSTLINAVLRAYVDAQLRAEQGRRIAEKSK
jgi:uncharacterized protein (DUF4415 family)